MNQFSGDNRVCVPTVDSLTMHSLTDRDHGFHMVMFDRAHLISLLQGNCTDIKWINISDQERILQTSHLTHPSPGPSLRRATSGQGRQRANRAARSLDQISPLQELLLQYRTLTTTMRALQVENESEPVSSDRNTSSQEVARLDGPNDYTSSDQPSSLFLTASEGSAYAQAQSIQSSFIATSASPSATRQQCLPLQ